MRQIFTKLSLILVVLLMATGGALAQFTVSGQVTDSENEPLIGVTITVKGKTLGTITDFNGRYSLEVPGTTATLLFSYIGYATVEQEVSSNDPSVSITLSDEATLLDEVVVTGLASSVKRSNLANAVATVNSQELTGITTQQTVDGALYGKMTGVNVVSSGGAPGGGIAIRLRGVSSLSGNNQPLFIVDGVYISNAEIPSGLRFASGANSGTEEGASNRIADLNPDDIESIEVLKGASAAAIYGTRANAGVVIITTKKGRAGKTDISLSQDFGINTIQRFIGRRQYTAAEVAERFNETEADRFRAAEAAGEIFDYEEEIYGETGFISDTRIKVSGGNEKTQFFFGGGIRDEGGIIKNTGYDRRSARLNINHKISDNLKFNISTNYINSYSRRSFTGNENEGGLSYGYTLAFTRDWVNLFPDADGTYPLNPNFAGNPIFVRDQTRNDERTNRLIQGVGVDWKIFQQDNQILQLKVNGGIDFFFHETDVYVPENHQSQIDVQNGFVGRGKNKIFNSNYQAFLAHDYYTEGNINFSTQVGISYLNFERDLIYNQTTQLLPLQNNLTLGGVQEINQRIELEEEFGIIAQEQVNIDDKIIGTVGVRFDKSSLNGDPNQFFAFPRASLAVNIANFDFFQSATFDALKVRVAYGETGSSADFGSLYTPFAPTNIAGNFGTAVQGSQGNTTLDPETSQEIEFGIDVSILKKLNLEVTYYNRNVNDLLYDRSLPASSGFSNEVRNDLDLVNRGLEIGLNISPVENKNFSWNSGVNFWFNRSEITRLGIVDSEVGDGDEDIPSFVPPGVAFGLGLGTFFIDEGSPITALWGNGDDGAEIIGDVEPDFQLGWSNSFFIGENLTVNFLVHWKQGGDVLNLTRLLTNLGGTTPAELDELEGFIEDASYFRLREIGAYYKIPLSSTFIESIRLGLSGRNLFTLTDYSSYDPETSTKGGGGLSTGIEVTPFPSSRQAYFHLTLNF